MFDNYPPLLTTTECCELLSVEKHAIYRLIDEGELQAVKINEKIWRISKDSLIYYTLKASGIDIDKEDIHDYI
jgi:excisionase family DNA binding protein